MGIGTQINLHPNQMQKEQNQVPAADVPSIIEYQSGFIRPHWTVLLVSAVFFMFTYFITEFALLASKWSLAPYRISSVFLSDALHAELPRLYVDLFFCAFFIGAWIAYFLSPTATGQLRRGFKWTKHIFRIQSLRRLLMLSSMQWDGGMTHNYTEGTQILRTAARLNPLDLNKRYETKSGSSITTVAILVAASILVLEQNLILIQSLDDLTIRAKLFTFLSFLSTVVCILFFVTSVDDLDTIFNDFKGEHQQVALDYYFYKRSSTPRFAGLALLVMSINFLVFARSDFFGCLAVSVSFSVFYPHMFPLFDERNLPVKDACWLRWGLIVCVLASGFLSIV